MAAIAIGVLAEKSLPWGGAVARVAGGGLIAWGSIALAAAVLSSAAATARAAAEPKGRRPHFLNHRHMR
jgi:hypothetical protein